MIDQYEQLRTSMIASDGELHTSGYGVFMLRGMLGLIKALPTFAPTLEEESEHTEIGSPGGVSDTLSENYTDVVNILANMIVCCQGEKP